MKKRGLKILGIVLVTLGIYLLLGSFTNITGFTIAEQIGNTTISIFGIALVVGGVLLLMIQGGIEQLISAEEFGERIDDVEPIKERRSLILDTSAVLNYSPNELKEMLGKYDKVYAPDSVLDEVKNGRLRRVIEENSQDLEGYGKYRNASRKLLEQGKKNLYQKEVIPIILGEAKPPKSRREAAPLVEEAKKLITNLQRSHKPITKENLIAEMENHYAVSEADVDVLAMGLYTARHRNHAIICEKDRDFEDAIKSIKKSQKKLGANIDFVNPYREAA